MAFSQERTPPPPRTGQPEHTPYTNSTSTPQHEHHERRGTPRNKRELERGEKECVHRRLILDPGPDPHVSSERGRTQVTQQ
ncbi:hypothetical protein Taro_014077 [Colocasia esculenta]|uniref:Uncharacterized protein n=1 Tax=Colocasia esculenta TaxID=4460 RepID=A0A843UDJ5_COLES|nr:hypothetical protein [Colocasia esculenta]